MTALIDIQQSICERISNALDYPVSGKPVQIGLHAQHGERPCTRAGERQSGRKCGLEESACRASQPCVFRTAKHRSQCPQGATVAVFRTNVFLPLAVIAEKVSEPASLVVEGEP